MLSRAVARIFTKSTGNLVLPPLVTSARWMSSDRRDTRDELKYEVRMMKRCDIQPLYELLTANKWSMEKSYLECVFNTDPTGLVVAATADGELIGHNGILIHSANVASSGMNIVKEEYRSFGVGKAIFRNVMECMQGRNVGGTALSNRISFYAQFGWTIKSYTFHYNQGPVNSDFISDCPDPECEIEAAESVDFNDVIAYDAELHTVPRPVYVSNWAESQIAKTLVAMRSGRVCGYGVLRPSDDGYKMYPLYADEPKIAKALFCRLASHVPAGSDLIFTQPIENDNANKFVAGNNLNTYLSMTRLYNKKNIQVDINRVYSVSTTEYGII